MSGFAGVLLIASIVGLVVLHKGKEKTKWFNKRNCIIVLVISLVIGGAASMGNVTTPAAVKVPTESAAATALGLANSAVALNLTGEDAIKSVVMGGVTRAQAITAINQVLAIRKKNIIPDTQAGIGKILNVKTDTKTDNSGSTKVSDTNNQYVIDYSYVSLGGADKLNNELGIVLSDKIHSIYTSYPNVDQLKFIISVPLTDKYGNVTWTPYRSFEITRALNNKINWNSDTFDKGTLLDLVTVQNTN